MDRSNGAQRTSMQVEWKKIEPQGKERPGPLSHHTSVVVNDKMYLFGGSGPRSKGQGDASPHPLWSLDMKSLRWEQVVSRGELPQTRDDHSAVLYDGNSLVVFGGFVDGERTNEILRYYIRENKWEEVVVRGDDCPKPRAGHSAVVHGHNMVIFGGRDEDSDKLNDVWLFNLQNYTWSHVLEA